jgi:hypothetical protein
VAYREFSPFSLINNEEMMPWWLGKIGRVVRNASVVT